MDYPGVQPLSKLRHHTACDHPQAQRARKERALQEKLAAEEAERVEVGPAAAVNENTPIYTAGAQLAKSQPVGPQDRPHPFSGGDELLDLSQIHQKYRHQKRLS